MAKRIVITTFGSFGDVFPYIGLALELGVSSTLRPGRYTARRAAPAIRALLEDEAIRARAASAGAEVRAEDGAAAACDALEALLGNAVTS